MLLMWAACGFDAVRRIFHHDAPFGHNAEFGGNDEEHLWIRFAAMNIFGRDGLLETVAEAQGLGG